MRHACNAVKTFQGNAAYTAYKRIEYAENAGKGWGASINRRTWMSSIDLSQKLWNLFLIRENDDRAEEKTIHCTLASRATAQFWSKIMRSWSCPTPWPRPPACTRHARTYAYMRIPCVHALSLDHTPLLSAPTAPEMRSKCGLGTRLPSLVSNIIMKKCPWKYSHDFYRWYLDFLWQFIHQVCWSLQNHDNKHDKRMAAVSLSQHSLAGVYVAVHLQPVFLLLWLIDWTLLNAN